VVAEEQEGFIWKKTRVQELIDHNIDKVNDLLASHEREELVKELAKNKQLLAEICQELDLEFPEEKKKQKEEKTGEVKEPEREEKSATEQSTTFMQRLREKLPGTTMASQIP